VKNNLLYIVFLILATMPVISQTSDTLTVVQDVKIEVAEDTDLIKDPYNPLAPAKAAFYSAVLPGLGQAYNKRYWKIPIIYGGMAAGIYFYVKNDEDYDRFRDAYKSRLAGNTDDEFYGDGDTPDISTDRLIDAQKSAQKNKDISLVVAIAFYLVNIIDANVDAHLRQYNVSEDLSLQPNVQFNPTNTQSNYGLSLKYKLK
jgi:hypothetical protein